MFDPLLSLTIIPINYISHSYLVETLNISQHDTRPENSLTSLISTTSERSESPPPINLFDHLLSLLPNHTADQSTAWTLLNHTPPWEVRIRINSPVIFLIYLLPPLSLYLYLSLSLSISLSPSISLSLSLSLSISVFIERCWIVILNLRRSSRYS